MNHQRSAHQQRNRIVGSRKTSMFKDEIQPVDFRFVKTASNDAVYGEKVTRFVDTNQHSSVIKVGPSRMAHDKPKQQHPQPSSSHPLRPPTISQRHHVVQEERKGGEPRKTSRSPSKSKSHRSKSAKNSKDPTGHHAIFSVSDSHSVGVPECEWINLLSSGEASSSTWTREEKEMDNMKRTIVEASDENEELLNDIQETISKCEVLAHKREKVIKENADLQQKQERMVEQLQELQEQLSHQSPSSVMTEFDEVSNRELKSVNKGRGDMSKGRPHSQDMSKGRPSENDLSTKGGRLPPENKSVQSSRKIMNTTGSSVLAERKKQFEKLKGYNGSKEEIKGAVEAINAGEDELNSQMLSNLLKNFLALLQERNNLKIELKQAELADLAQMEQHTKDSLSWLREKQNLMFQIQCQLECLQGLRSEIQSLKEAQQSSSGDFTSKTSKELDGVEAWKFQKGNRMMTRSPSNGSSTGSESHSSSDLLASSFSSSSTSFNMEPTRSFQSSGSGTSSGRSRADSNDSFENGERTEHLLRSRSKQRSHPSLRFEGTSPLTIHSTHNPTCRTNNRVAFAPPQRRKSESALHRNSRAGTPICHLMEGNNHGVTTDDPPPVSRYVNLTFPTTVGANGSRRNEDLLQTTARGGQEERDRRKVLRDLLRMSTITE